jgi:hypothetical protein
MINKLEPNYFIKDLIVEDPTITGNESLEYIKDRLVKKIKDNEEFKKMPWLVPVIKSEWELMGDVKIFIDNIRYFFTNKYKYSNLRKILRLSLIYYGNLPDDMKVNKIKNKIDDVDKEIDNVLD